MRPPTYNAEDYAIALRRWGRRPLGTVQDSQGTLPSTTSSSSGYASGSGEMTLRQFTSVSELLNKLRADLRLAFPRSVCYYFMLLVKSIRLIIASNDQLVHPLIKLFSQIFNLMTKQRTDMGKKKKKRTRQINKNIFITRAFSRDVCACVALPTVK